VWAVMSPLDPDRIIIRRRPGGGRKPAPYSPVMAVSVSMSIDEKRRIDAAALKANRTRSAFIRHACYQAIERMGGLDEFAPVETPAESLAERRMRSPVWLEDTAAGPITVAERERRLDEGEHPDTVWAAFGDPTRGGRWNPAMFGSIVDCVACPARIPSAAVYCLSCGVEQPDAAAGVV